jgi:hypothetical protein
MNKAWLCLLLLLPARFAAAETEVEAPDRRSCAEANPQMLARRAVSCRADLKDYQVQPALEIMDRLIVCMEHPDARLRAEVLDLLPDRRLWDRDDYESKVAPELGKIYARFQHDPDETVRMHAGQLMMWLSNGEQWRNWESPAAQARRRAQEQDPHRHATVDGESMKLGNYALYATVIAVALMALFGRRFL